MPSVVDFSWTRHEDGVVVVVMTPPVPIGAWDIRLVVGKRFGSETALIQKSVASGFNGASGITITNSGQGIFSIALNGPDTSGMDYGNFAYECARYGSGGRTPINQGYMLLGPSMG